MPSYIVKLQDGATECLLVWSTVVDAPVTFGMSRKDFTEWYRSEYGREGMKELPERISRVDQYGTSCAWSHQSAEDMLHGNRAGPGETDFSVAEIIERYCRTQRGSKP